MTGKSGGKTNSEKVPGGESNIRGSSIKLNLEQHVVAYANLSFEHNGESLVSDAFKSTPKDSVLYASIHGSMKRKGNLKTGCIEDGSKENDKAKTDVNINANDSLAHPLKNVTDSNAIETQEDAHSSPKCRITKCTKICLILVATCLIVTLTGGGILIVWLRKSEQEQTALNNSQQHNLSSSAWLITEANESSVMSVKWQTEITTFLDDREYTEELNTSQKYSQDKSAEDKQLTGLKKYEEAESTCQYKNENTCYHVPVDKLSYAESMKFCEKKRMHLVVLGKWKEWMFVSKKIVGKGTRGFRIAARNRPPSDAKGKYFWEHNATNRTQVQYAKNPFSWNTQKMMKRKQDQTTCLVIKKIKKLVFDAEKCGTRKGFICEAQIIS